MTAASRRLTEEEKLRFGSEIQRRVGVKTSRDEPLGRFTTMRVGGPADLFAVARNLFELRGLVRFARSRELPLFLLGRGSDLVISDRGIGGLVLQVRAEGTRVEGTRVTVESRGAHGPAGDPREGCRTDRRRVRARHPGDGRRRRLGERRRPRRRTCVPSWPRPA